jgi:hypothetical protein
MRELQAAWDIRYAGQTAGADDSTRLHFIAPRLVAAAPRLFEQGTLFEELVAPDDTGFDVTGRMLADVAAGVGDSERFDAPLLKDVFAFDRSLRVGIESIHLAGNKLEELRQTDITVSVTQSARSLYAEIPSPRRVRVAGTLDMIRVSDRVFELMLMNGSRVRAVWSADTVVHLKEYLSRQVVIEGNAIFRPSGSVLRIDAGAIAPAHEQDLFFSEMPTPVRGGSDIQSMRRPQTSTTGLNAIWGTWPGEESEAELLATLEEIE